MSQKIPHEREASNDNAGERCQHCGLCHAGRSPDELEQLAERRRIDEADSDKYEFCPPGLGWLGRALRGIPGVCPVAFSPLEKALLFQARRTSALLAIAAERPSLASMIAQIVERSAMGLAVSEHEPLSRLKPTRDDTAVIYEAARFAAMKLLASGLDESTVRKRVGDSLAQLRRVARVRSLDESEFPHGHDALEKWLTETREESKTFGLWIQRTLPEYMRVASSRNPSARAVATAITGEENDGAPSDARCPFPRFRTMRERWEWGVAKAPWQQLTEELLASAIVFDATRDPAPLSADAANW